MGFRVLLSSGFVKESRPEFSLANDRAFSGFGPTDQTCRLNPDTRSTGLFAPSFYKDVI